MLSNLLSILRGKTFLAQVLDEFHEMLDKTEFMFSAVCEALIEGQPNPQLKEKIYSTDKEVNELQKDIRKRIVTHLAIQPTADIPSCLLFMSVVKDAERLGDYAKNLYEVIDLHTKPINRSLFSQFFDGMDEKIINLFKETKKVFLESYDSKTHSSWIHETKVGKRCDAILKEIVESNIGTNDAVCVTLIARYYKRISAHLVNIATSAVVPISDLDYFDENIQKIQADSPKEILP